MAYFINPSRQSVCLYVYLLIAARQRLGKNVTAAMNTHETIEESLDALFWRRGRQPHAPAALYPQEASWYSFLLEGESTPEP
jgi:hypothetical protein